MTNHTPHPNSHTFTTETLFQQALNIQAPWTVEKIEFRDTEGETPIKELHIHLHIEKGIKHQCEHCTEVHSTYDKADRTWKHLRFFEHPTYIHASVPRIQCIETKHTTNILVPWARKDSGFTLLFEIMTLELAKHIPMTLVASMTGELDKTIYRIVDYYVDKAREKEDFSTVTRIGLDETSSRKGHNYISSFIDMDNDKVLSLSEGKDSVVVQRLLVDFEKHKGRRETITEVCADLSSAFRSGVQKELPHVTITSDRFHVMQLVSKAQDKVRRREREKGADTKNLRFALLSNPENQTETQKQLITTLNEEHSETLKAYQMRLNLKAIYDDSMGKEYAQTRLEAWILYVMQSKIPEMIQVAGTITTYMKEILQYFSSKLTNGMVEGMNNRIQMIKRRGRGFRNIKHFMTMIYLKCGKLTFDMKGVLAYPR